MSQSQKAGQDSTNVQAGRDVAIFQGLSYSEAKDVALSVFKENFIALKGEAEKTARERAEELTEDFLKRMEARFPGGVDSAADPDMQRTVFRAQEGYACSGDADLEKALVELLVDRAAEPGQDTVSIVLNEAIASMPKLTSDQRNALGFAFVVRRTRYLGPFDVEAYYRGHVEELLQPLSQNIAKLQTAYQHIEYVGAASISVLEIKLADLMRRTTPGLFTKGFERDQIPDELTGLREVSGFFVPCLRDPSKLQVGLQDADGIAAAMKHLGLTDLEPAVLQLLDVGRMSDEEVEVEMRQRCPAFGPTLTLWDEGPLRFMQLTSVGIAIGHAIWRQISGKQADLRQWFVQ